MVADNNKCHFPFSKFIIKIMSYPLLLKQVTGDLSTYSDLKGTDEGVGLFFINERRGRCRDILCQNFC